jgi:hypothetical protein
MMAHQNHGQGTPDMVAIPEEFKDLLTQKKAFAHLATLMKGKRCSVAVGFPD